MQIAVRTWLREAWSWPGGTKRAYGRTLVILMALAGCTDRETATNELRAKCRQSAAVFVADEAGWADYLSELAESYRTQVPAPRYFQLRNTKHFYLRPEGGRPIPPHAKKGVIYSLRIEVMGSRPIATAQDFALSLDFLGNSTSWTCNSPGMPAEVWKIANPFAQARP